MRVLVTGGMGFLGSHLLPILRGEGIPFLAPNRHILNLLDETEVEAFFQSHRDLTHVIHLAAKVGGIGANLKFPADLAYPNLRMGLNLFHSAFRHGIQKFVNVGTVCSYPKFTPVPFREEDLWNGSPEESNAPYGLAKKMMLVLSDAYRRQYGFNSVNLLLANLYGEGDSFDPEASHVIPALIRKFVAASAENRPTVSVWGTGTASREFLYAGDAAEILVRALYRYDSSEPVNVGTGIETSIRELARLIAETVGFAGEIRWDASRPDGQPRRCLDTRRMKRELGDFDFTPLREGLKKTIRWYLESRHPFREGSNPATAHLRPAGCSYE
jgi:GDP-L-fucose synthase